jgi:hypothetical protein
MILFHGTTSSRAEMIRQYGFQNPDLDSELAKIASQYDVSHASLQTQLSNNGRIVTSRLGEKRVYFSSHLLHAASYATRAPEFYWEALWAIYVLRNPELGFNWNQSDEGHAWVLSQMQTDPPVVLHVEIPGELLGEDAEKISQWVEDMPAESESGGSEIALSPSPELQVVGQTEGDYWIDNSLLRFLSGLSPEEIGKQVDEGLWGKPFSYHFDNFWLWKNVKALMTAERLEELDLT